MFKTILLTLELGHEETWNRALPIAVDAARKWSAQLHLLTVVPEVAVPRLVEIFRRLGMRQTFFVPGWCLEHYPKATRLLVDNGHEIAHHGIERSVRK